MCGGQEKRQRPGLRRLPPARGLERQPRGNVLRQRGGPGTPPPRSLVSSSARMRLPAARRPQSGLSGLIRDACLARRTGPVRRADFLLPPAPTPTPNPAPQAPGPQNSNSDSSLGP